MKITITRVLVELKMLDKKIRQAMNDQVIGLYQKKGGAIIGTLFSREDFEKRAIEKMQSIKDLVTRAETLRLALAKANATNKVKIGSREMTIAEALVFKDRVVPLMEEIANNYSNRAVEFANQVEKNRIELEKNVSAMLEQNLGNDRKADKDAYDAIAGKFTEANSLHVSDAGKATEYAESLKKTVSEFQSEVDVVLAEANARIEIEV